MLAIIQAIFNVGALAWLIFLDHEVRRQRRSRQRIKAFERSLGEARRRILDRLDEADAADRQKEDPSS